MQQFGLAAGVEVDNVANSNNYQHPQHVNPLGLDHCDTALWPSTQPRDAISEIFKHGVTVGGRNGEARLADAGQALAEITIHATRKGKYF